MNFSFQPSLKLLSINKDGNQQVSLKNPEDLEKSLKSTFGPKQPNKQAEKKKTANIWAKRNLESGKFDQTKWKK